MLQRAFIIRTPAQWQQMVAFFKANWSEDRPLAVVVSEPSARRTVEQNSAYHAIFRDIAAQAWVQGKQFDPATWKFFMVRRFIPGEMMTLPDGQVVERQRSTTELTVAEASEFIDASRAYAATELGLTV